MLNITERKFFYLPLFPSTAQIPYFHYCLVWTLTVLCVSRNLISYPVHLIWAFHNSHMTLVAPACNENFKLTSFSQSPKEPFPRSHILTPRPISRNMLERSGSQRLSIWPDFTCPIFLAKCCKNYHLTTSGSSLSQFQLQLLSHFLLLVSTAEPRIHKNYLLICYS